MKVRPDLGELQWGVLCSLPRTLFAALSSFLHPSERHSAFHYDLTSPLMMSGAIFNCFWIWKCKRERRNTKEMQVAVAWMTCCKQSPAGLETPLWAAVLHSLLAHLYTVLLIQTARWILSDLSCVFFHFLVQRFCPKFLSSLREMGQVGWGKKWHYYPVTLTLELAATKVVIIRLFTETRPTSQSFSQTTGHVY